MITSCTKPQVPFHFVTHGIGYMKYCRLIRVSFNLFSVTQLIYHIISISDLFSPRLRYVIWFGVDFSSNSVSIQINIYKLTKLAMIHWNNGPIKLYPTKEQLFTHAETGAAVAAIRYAGLPLVETFSNSNFTVFCMFSLLILRGQQPPLSSLGVVYESWCCGPESRGDPWTPKLMLHHSDEIVYGF